MNSNIKNVATGIDRITTEEIVEAIRLYRPIEECETCMEKWKALGQAYQMWYTCTSDNCAKMLVAQALLAYLNHYINHCDLG